MSFVVNNNTWLLHDARWFVMHDGKFGLMMLISDGIWTESCCLERWPMRINVADFWCIWTGFSTVFSFFFLAIRLGNVVNDEYCYWFVMLMNRFVNTWSNFSCYLARKGGEWWLMLLICDAYEQIYLIFFFFFSLLFVPFFMHSFPD